MPPRSNSPRCGHPQCTSVATEHNKTRCILHSNKALGGGWSDNNDSSQSDDNDDDGDWSDMEESVDGDGTRKAPLRKRAFRIVFGSTRARQQGRRLRAARSYASQTEAVQTLLDQVVSTHSMLRTIAFRLCRMSAFNRQYYQHSHLLRRRMEYIESLYQQVAPNYEPYRDEAPWTPTEEEKELEKYFLYVDEPRE